MYVYGAIQKHDVREALANAALRIWVRTYDCEKKARILWELCFIETLQTVLTRIRYTTIQIQKHGQQSMNYNSFFQYPNPHLTLNRALCTLYVSLSV